MTFLGGGETHSRATKVLKPPSLNSLNNLTSLFSESSADTVIIITEEEGTTNKLYFLALQKRHKQGINGIQKYVAFLTLISAINIFL